VEAAQLASLKERVEKAEKMMAANLKRVSDAGITVAMGTDAGNPLTLHGPSIYAEMEAMQASGLTPMQVLVDSTRGGARAMGTEKITGTLEKGKVADLIVVGADPTRNVANLRRLRLVVRAGAVQTIPELRDAASK
jgi:imidazolonepropionase-like amidohydrolase